MHHNPSNSTNTMMQWLPDDTVDALRMMADRYDLTPHVILHIAPLLMHVVAQQSLTFRRMALKRKIDAQTAMDADGEAFLLHGAGMFPMDRFAEAQEAERVSLDAEDILGRRIADATDTLAHSATGPEDSAFATRNPLVRHIRAACVGIVDDLRITDQVVSYRVIENAASL